MSAGRVITAALAMLVVAAAHACVALSPQRLAAQGLGSGLITGTVRDSTGRPVPAASITLTNERTGRQQFLRASRDGRFTTGFVAPGRYTALFESLGFVPELLGDIVVVPGQRVALPVTLVRSQTERVDPSAARMDITAIGGVEAPPSQWMTTRGASALPFDGLGVNAATLLSSRAGPLGDVEGLPASMTTLVVDGIPAALRPRELGTYVRSASLPLSSFDLVELVTDAADVEWPASGGSLLTALTRQGSKQLASQLFGDWAGDALGSAADAPPFLNYRIGGQVGGPVVPDTAHFIVGAEYLQSEMPFDRIWSPDSETTRLIDALDQDYGAALARYARPTTGGIERMTAFGRLDLRLGSTHELSVRGNVGLLPRLDPIAPRSGFLLGPGTSSEARELFATATLFSRLDDDGLRKNELNAGFELGRYSRDASAVDPDIDLPSTTIATSGHDFGWADGTPFRSELRAFYVRETLHDERGSHNLKYGLSVMLPIYELSYEHLNSGEFLFPSVDDLLLRRGAYRRTEAGAAPAEMLFRRFTFYAQDTWTPSPGLELTMGLRYALNRMPDSAGIPIDTQFVDYTSILNRRIGVRHGQFEPLFAFSWAPNGGREWRLRGTATIESQLSSPDLVGEVFSNSGGSVTFAGIGNLGTWPAAPNPSIAPARGKMLTVLGPNFRGSQTTRVSASLSRTLPGLGAVSVSGVVRNTDYLPRRRDLNLLPVPTTVDQHDRRIFGELLKVGGLLAARPPTNRRFVEYDRVWAIEATGQSDYRGITVSVRRPLLRSVALHASYTYSETEDNWLLGNDRDPETQINPFPLDIYGTGWARGRSDLDVPHRLVLGTELKIPGQYGPSIAGLYRFQSGYPFTPGFRDGVDVNGDGSARNDVAFIDPAIAGTDQLVASWPCLATRLEKFAVRNSCRGPDLHSLDARLSLNVVQNDRYAAQFVIDGLNLLGSDAGVVDRAVYLIDPATGSGGAPETICDSSQPACSIPFVINPEFGQVRTRYAPQRMIRLGLRLSY